MRYLTIAIVAAASAVAFTQIASAADMPVKALRYAPKPPPEVYSWTGFYVGGNVGYSWGNADTDFNASPTTVNVINNPPIVSVDIPGFVGSETVKPQGIIGGGQSRLQLAIHAALGRRR